MLQRPFLHRYRSLARQAMRTERVIASGRAFLAITGLAAIYLDPTEPARFATLTYALLSSYALYSVVILALVRRLARLSTGLTYGFHALDILWASALTFFSAGPFSPFFLFFLFVLLAAAFRGGLSETLVTTLITAVIFLLESLVASVGPWNRTWFGGDFQSTPVIVRIAYLLLTGFLLGFLADQEKQFRAELAAQAELIEQPRVDLGFGASLAGIGRLLLQMFRASSADIVVRDHEDSRTMLWHVEPERNGSDGPLERTELEDAHSASWLFPVESRIWVSLGPRQGEELAAVGFDRDKWAVSPISVTVPSEFADNREFSSVAAVDFGLPGEWRGRLLLYDALELQRAPIRLHFLDSLADHVTPALTNVFLLKRLRSRASAEERARVARELHDGAVQALIGIEMEAEALRRRAERERGPYGPELAHIQRLLRDEVIALRGLMQELRPVDLDGSHQLPQVLAGVVDRFRRDTGVSAQFVSSAGTVSLPVRTAVEVVRILQEALVNVRKHSHAEHVVVRLAEQNGGWALSVEDDGRGFDFEGRLTGSELDARCVGPAIIIERARTIGGMVAVESTPSAGARVEVTFSARSQV